MNVKDLLKKATQLKKEKNIEEAIDMLDQAYLKAYMNLHLNFQMISQTQN